MIPDSVVKQIENKYQPLSPLLNERSRRLWAATEAEALGYGGILALHRATGLSQNTIRAGLKELSGESTELLAPQRIRKVGGGRKRVEARDPLILEQTHTPHIFIHDPIVKSQFGFEFLSYGLYRFDLKLHRNEFWGAGAVPLRGGCAPTPLLYLCKLTLNWY